MNKPSIALALTTSLGLTFFTACSELNTQGPAHQTTQQRNQITATPDNVVAVEYEGAIYWVEYNRDPDGSNIALQLLKNGTAEQTPLPPAHITTVTAWPEDIDLPTDIQTAESGSALAADMGRLLGANSPGSEPELATP